MYSTQNMSGTYKILNGGRGSDNGLSLSSPSHFLSSSFPSPTPASSYYIIAAVGRGGGIAIPRQVNGLGLE